MARNPTSENPTREKMKGAERILADVFDHSAIGLAIFDDRLRYRALNSGLAAMNGIPAESHFGKSLREILGAVASRVEPAVKQVFTTGRPILNLEITGVLPTRAGRGRWVDHLFPLKDATGRVKRVTYVKSGRELDVLLPATIRRFVAEKGSIAVDGISLTVAAVDQTSFSVALIPHTLEVTIAGAYEPGSVVNIEADVVARYVARNLRR